VIHNHGSPNLNSPSIILEGIRICCRLVAPPPQFQCPTFYPQVILAWQDFYINENLIVAKPGEAIEVEC
jgi:hypothetical protein